MQHLIMHEICFDALTWQEAANLQAQFLNAQFETASRQLKELYGTPDVETSKTSIEIK